MEVLKLLLLGVLVWIGWKYIIKKESAAKPTPTPQPTPTLSPSADSLRNDEIQEKCRALLRPGAFTADGAALLLLDLRGTPAQHKSTDIDMLETVLEIACEDNVLTPKEQREIKFWLAAACGDSAGMLDHRDEDDTDATDDDETDDATDPREAYLLENSTLSDHGRYEFDYEDGRGAFSSRRVDVLYVDGDYLEAYDHGAGAMRTFRKTRIQGPVTDTDTGELLEPREMNRKRLGIKKIDFEAMGI